MAYNGFTLPTSPSSATFWNLGDSLLQEIMEKSLSKNASGTVARTHPKSSKYMHGDGIRASFRQLIAVSKMHVHHCTQHKP